MMISLDCIDDIPPLYRISPTVLMISLNGTDDIPPLYIRYCTAQDDRIQRLILFLKL